MHQTSKIKILTKNTIWVYIGQIGMQILAFVTAVLVIRKLDVEMYGVYNLLLKFIVIYNVLSESPVASVFNRYIPEMAENRDGHRIRKLIAAGTSLVVITAILISMLIFRYSDKISDFLNITNFDAYKISLFGYIITMMLKLSIISILTSFLKHKQTSVLHISSSLIRSILLVIFLSKLNVNLLLVIEVITSLIYIIPGYVMVRSSIRSVQPAVRVARDKSVTRKRVFMYGMYSSMNEVGAGIVGKTSDYFIVSAISNMHTVGIYSFATKIYDLIFKMLPFKEFMTIIRPLFFMKFTKKHEDEEFQNVYNLMIKILIPIFVIPCLYFMVFGKSLILYVFDPKYIDAYLVCVLVLASNLYSPFFSPITLVMQLKERMDVALTSKIVVVFSIAGGIYAMKAFGIVGVATVTLIGDLLKNLMILVLLKRDIRIVYRMKELRNYAFVFLGINLPMFALANYYVTIPMLVAGTLLYFPLTLLLIVWFHPFNAYDLSILERFGQTNKVAGKVQEVVLRIYRLRFSRSLIRKAEVTEI